MIKLAFRAFSALGIARKKPRTCVDTQILSQLITQGDDVSVVVQHHVPVEGLLSPVQRVPPLPGEVQSLVLKGQQPPETQSHYSRSSYHSFVGHSIIIVLQPRLIQ